MEVARTLFATMAGVFESESAPLSDAYLGRLLLADNDDTHALEFYRALGGVATPVTFFTFGDTAA